jgi:hypothetical protein
MSPGLHPRSDLDRLGDLRDAVDDFIEPAALDIQARAGHLQR